MQKHYHDYKSATSNSITITTPAVGGLKSFVAIEAYIITIQFR
jgi:hypothetical protein